MKAASLRRHVVLLAVLLGAFSLVLTNSAFNVLLPSFVRLYGISASLGGWIIALYMLAMTVTMPLTALAVDRFGRKRTYLLGLALYGVFAALGGLFCQYVQVVLLVRLMHGIAAGLMIPLSLVLLFDHYGTKSRGKVVGVWGMLLTIAPAIGPTLGGAVMQFGRLSYLFWFNVPLALAALLLCSAQIRHYEPARRKTVRWTGVMLGIAGIAAFSLGIQLVSADGVPGWAAALLLLAGAAATARFVWRDSRREEPLIRYGLLRRHPVFAASLLVSGVQDCVMFGVIFALPLLFQEALHLPPSAAGAMFVPTAVCTSLFAWIGGHWVDAGRSLRFISWGIVFVSASVLAFAFVPLGTPAAILLLLMGLRGVGNGLSDMTMTAIGLNALPEEDLHEGAALSNTLQRLASSFAVMLLAVYYDMRSQALARSGELLEHARWTALKEECLALGCLMALVLPFIHFISRKKVDALARYENEPAA